MPDVTPLPFLTRVSSQVPGVRLGVAADGFRVLDLGAGTMSQSVVTNPSTDAVVRDPNGNGWVCVCMLDLGTIARGDTRIVDLVRIAPNGGELDRRGVWTIDGGGDPASSLAIKTDVQVAADGRSALLAVAREGATGWDLRIARVDLRTGLVSNALGLGRIESNAAPGAPSSDPSPGTVSSQPLQIDLSGPSIRRSPDGRTAFVWTTSALTGPGVVPEPRVTGWRVDLAPDGTPISTGMAPDLSRLAPSCTGGGFVDNDRFVALCTAFPTTGSTAAVSRLTELDRTGTFVDQIDLPPTAHFYVDPLLDTANGVAWVWNPTDFVLLRVAADGLGLVSHTFQAGVTEAPGVRDFGSRTPAWASTSSSVLVNRAQQIVGSPDGSSLYLLAYGPLTDVNAGRPPSFGTLVVDQRTLALTDHWAPDAAALSVSPVADGSIVAVAGLPGADANGNAVGWQGSLTFHRANDGSVIVQFGQLGSNYLPLLAGP